MCVWLFKGATRNQESGREESVSGAWDVGSIADKPKRMKNTNLGMGRGEKLQEMGLVRC